MSTCVLCPRSTFVHLCAVSLLVFVYSSYVHMCPVSLLVFVYSSYVHLCPRFTFVHLCLVSLLVFVYSSYVHLCPMFQGHLCTPVYYFPPTVCIYSSFKSINSRWLPASTW